MELCLAFGRTLQELENSMDAAEYIEWLAYYRLRPFGHERSDYAAAVIAAQIANVHRDTKKKKQPFEPRDFMYSTHYPVKSQQEREQDSYDASMSIKARFQAWIKSRKGR